MHRCMHSVVKCSKSQLPKMDPRDSLLRAREEGRHVKTPYRVIY